ncbi:MAG: carbohydrate ABC transporter permease [Acidimicrobiia bacterium]|nr:carbohydrate ABC transporter permease [Acidimicrobiia bacterium]NDE79335.1 carbohydrate ABC transporter permease [Actinomycetota bacterium]
MALDTTPKGWRSWVRYTLLILMAVIILFPIYTTIIASLKPGNRVLRNPLVPDSFTLDVLRNAWTQGRLGRYLWNSAVVAFIVTTFQLITSIMSAYAFSFLRFPLKRFIFAIFMATLLVPFEVTLLINRRTVNSLGWLNTYQGLAVPFLATAFGTFLLRQVFMQIPKDLNEAAAMDGLGHWGFMREVAVPLVRPTLGALGLFSFLASWNQYLWPTMITTEDDMNTIQSGLRLLRSSDLDKPNLVMAGTIIAAIPILVVLVVFQRQLVRGLTAGAVKG